MRRVRFALVQYSTEQRGTIQCVILVQYGMCSTVQHSTNGRTVWIMYDEKTKARNIKSLQKNFEQVRLTVKRGTLAKYKAFAERQGMSMTAYIVQLMEREMAESGFGAEWDKKVRAEQDAAEREREAVLAEIRAGMKPPARK